MCCPQCESNSLEHWIIVDETGVYKDYHGKDLLYIVRGCKCNECGRTWYEHYIGRATDFYWTND